MKPFKLYKIYNTTLEVYHIHKTINTNLQTQLSQATHQIETLKKVYKDCPIELHEFVAIPAPLVTEIITWIQQADNEVSGRKEDLLASLKECL